MRKLLGCLRRAVNDFNMIEENDHIVVGLSGGKDSIAMLTCLKLYQRFSPVKFKLTAVTIDMGFKDINQNEIETLKMYCKDNEIDYIIEKTDMAEIIFNVKKEGRPCSLCSKMRRGALNTKCISLNANKLALAHHSEDCLETFLLSFIYEGRLSTFMPYSYMDRTEITLIRPFIYASEGDIKGAVKRNNLPLLHNPCPMNHVSQREYMKNLVNNICKDIPFAKDRMISAIMKPERYNLFPPKQET